MNTLLSLTREEVLKKAQKRLRAVAKEKSRSEARLLLSAVLQVTIENILMHPEKEISKDQEKLFDEFVTRREKFEPISRILKAREFWSLSFKITPDTLDPRPDSEVLIEAVLQDFSSDQKVKILDLGTGSGCLLLSLLHELPDAQGVGVGISFEALKVAQENAKILSLLEKVLWVQGNWAESLKGPFDIVITNPPYISKADIENLKPDVRLYDPYKALAGGEDGLECYQIIVRQFEFLCHLETKIYIEIGQNQHNDLDLLMKNHNFKSQKWFKDLSGIKRCGVYSLNFKK